MNYFGTNFGKNKNWNNPADAGLIEVTCSTIDRDSEPINKMLGNF